MENRWFPTPDFEGTQNFKEFFLRDDALNNISTELVFSIFKRYMCKAGCKMCYVKDMWMPDANFGAFVPKEINSQTEENIIDSWKYFEIVSMMDDLFWIKKNYPHLFDFYKRHSSKLCSTAMTDIAFIQQFDIVMKEMDFRYVYEISFSDRFLSKNNGKFAHDLTARLADVHAKSPLQKIKIIFCDDQSERNPNVVTLIDWAEARNICIDVHDDITQGENRRFDLEKADRQETNHYSEYSYPFLILCEVTYLQYDEMFLTITDALSEDSKPFYNITDSKLDPHAFIAAMLKEKINTYENNIPRMSRNHSSAKYMDYFSYVSSSIKVNDNYNFIPNFMLKPYSKMYQELKHHEFVDTRYGLLLASSAISTANIVPLVSVADKPNVKIYHIPIKCAPVETTI